MSKKDHIPTMVKIAIENGFENKYINYNLGMKIEEIKIDIMNSIIKFEKKQLNEEDLKTVSILKKEYYNCIKNFDILIEEIENKSIIELNSLVEELKKCNSKLSLLSIKIFSEKKKVNNLKGIELKLEILEDEKEKSKVDYKLYKERVIELEKSRKKEIKKHFNNVLTLLESRIKNINLPDSIKKEGINNFIKNLYLLLETIPHLHLNEKGKNFLKKSVTKVKDKEIKEKIILLMKEKKWNELGLELKKNNFLKPISKYLSNMLEMTESNQLEKYFWVNRLAEKELENIKEIVFKLEKLNVEERVVYIENEVKKRIFNNYKAQEENNIEFKNVLDVKAFIIIGLCELIANSNKSKNIIINNFSDITLKELIKECNEVFPKFETIEDYYDNSKEKVIFDMSLSSPYVKEVDKRKIISILEVTYVEDTVGKYFVSFIHINTLINFLSEKYKSLNDKNLKKLLEISKTINYTSLDNLCDAGLYIFTFQEFINFLKEK